MIFFVHDDVGYKIIKFILSTYPEDIKIIFCKEIKKNFKRELKKKSPKAKYLLWKNKNEKKFVNLINIHPSYLPYFKGKDPNFWSILFNGPFGVSIHYVNKLIDSGAIIFREKINDFGYDKNAKDLHDISKKHINKRYS